MNNIYEMIISSLNDSQFRKLIISGGIRGKCIYKKIVVVPKMDSSGLFYQFEMFFENKVKHENFRNADQAACNIMEYLEKGYKQTDIFLVSNMLRIYKNKNGFSVIKRAVSLPDREPDKHNRDKNYLIKESAPFLQGLGVTGNDGRVLGDKQKKFRQINRYVELIGDIAKNIPREPKILDIGCGYAYLSFALYHYLAQIGFKPIILGVDIKADVIANCQQLANEIGFGGMRFEVCDAKNLNSVEFSPDMVISLHACDTLTDYAIAHAVLRKCSTIIAAPCCQHELYGQIKDSELSLILKHGILKERFAALITDSVRALIMESCGYKAQVIEFIDSEHTQKNIMLRAVKKDIADTDEKRILLLQELQTVMERFSITPTLYSLLREVLL